MIKSIHLKNFKGHQDSLVEFGPVTTFIGRNDKGKSTVGFKALKIALTGRNWDPKWLRHGTDQGSIVIEMDDGTKVERSRNLNKQAVRITDPAGKSEKFTGQKDSLNFVLAVTKVRKVELDSQEGPEDLNFIRNGQQAFLLENSPEVVQRKVVGILRCNEIESAKIRLTKRLNQRKDEQKYLAEENQRLLGRLKSLISVREKVHQVDDALDDAIDRHQQAYDQIELLRSLKECVHLYRYTGEKARICRSLLEIGTKAQQLSGQVMLVQELSNVQDSKTWDHRRIASLRGLTLLTERQQIREVVLDTRELIAELRSQISELQISSAEQLLDQGVCPICGTKLSAT